MTKKVEKVSAQEKDWMQNKWRPAMGWMYMMVCVFDFIVFPILWAIVQSMATANFTRCRLIPYGYGCCSWYFGLR